LSYAVEVTIMVKIAYADETNLRKRRSLWTYAQDKFGLSKKLKYLMPTLNFFSPSNERPIDECIETFHSIVFSDESPKLWWDRNQNNVGHTVMAMMKRAFPGKSDGRSNPRPRTYFSFNFQLEKFCVFQK